jgi:hypothetical protein
VRCMFRLKQAIIGPVPRALKRKTKRLAGGFFFLTSSHKLDDGQ